ncbi:MAG: hypothetical protein JSV43_04245 [Methanobacteriota archaeon]|nr:MAG: hypothetical protein JSV43_04245 [Euryarchaeota archaeon]
MRRIPDVRVKDFNKMGFALALILVGVVGRVLLYKYSNFETVLVVSLLAGTLLGKVYALIVPLATMAISDLAIYTLGFGGHYGIGIIIGLAFFTWTGFLFVGFIGTRLKGKVICITKSIALVTGVGMIATLIFDVWTTVGYWLFFLPHTAGGFGIAFVQLAPFAVYHLMSSLMFIPLVGTIFIYIHENGIPSLNISPIARKSDDERDSTEACPA